jgi:ADP-ribose pyrophosphatase YjhB (NUDIX family)
MRVRVAGFLKINDTVLMVEHIKAGKSYWLLPGGGVNLGEDTESALKRELKEELNLECHVNDLLFVVESHNDRGDHIIQPTYLVETENIDLLAPGSDKRVNNFAFFDQDKIISSVIYPDIKQELREYLISKKINKRYIYKKWIN